MSTIESNLQRVLRARDTAIAAQPASSRQMVTVVAVSKTKPAAAVRDAFFAGQRDFGENYVQEGIAKIAECADLKASPTLQPTQPIIWHFIGPLQSNKAKLVAAHFDWVHGVDRLKIATALSSARTALQLKPLNVCVQVNVSGEVSKSGVTPTEALQLGQQIALLPGLKLRGLMTIIENTPDIAAQRAQFQQMRHCMQAFNDAGFAVDTLSMGMSQDFRIAIEEGATMIRIGSAIFGERDHPNNAGATIVAGNKLQGQQTT